MDAIVYVWGALLLWFPCFMWCAFNLIKHNHIGDGLDLLGYIVVSLVLGLLLALAWPAVIPILILYAVCVKLFPYIKYLKGE